MCTWRGNNCCSWHRLSPDRERRLLITGEHRNGRKTGKDRIRPLAPAWQNTYYLEDTGLFRVSLSTSQVGTTHSAVRAQSPATQQKAKCHFALARRCLYSPES